MTFEVMWETFISFHSPFFFFPSFFFFCCRYNYEKTLHQTTNRIISNDLYWAMAIRRTACHKGIMPVGLRCALSRRRLCDKQADIVLFGCGHAYYAESIEFNPDDAAGVSCHVCQSASQVGKRRKGKTSLKMLPRP